MGVGLSDYRAALDFLVARTTGKDRLGLERTLAVLRALGDPHLALRTFHVAGTNGKGSVVATLDTLLRISEALGVRLERLIAAARRANPSSGVPSRPSTEPGGGLRKRPD